MKANTKDMILLVASILCIITGFALSIVYIAYTNKSIEQRNQLIYAGNVDGNLIDFAVKYHGEGNAHYSDSLGYWYFYRDGEKMRLINEGVMKSWEKKR